MGPQRVTASEEAFTQAAGQAGPPSTTCQACCVLCASYLSSVCMATFSTPPGKGEMSVHSSLWEGALVFYLALRVLQSLLILSDCWSKLRHALSGTLYEIKKPMSWVRNRWQLLLSCGPLSKMDRAIQDCGYNSKDGSWVWAGHRQGPVLCKAGQRGVQDSTQEPRHSKSVCSRGRPCSDGSSE